MILKCSDGFAVLKPVGCDSGHGQGEKTRASMSALTFFFVFV